MYLKSLTLQNFKNHSLSKFNFFNKVICFVGKNGSGKTNILDSIHYLSLTKSYFNHVDSLNVKFDEDYFIIKGNFLKNDEDFLVECNYQNKLGKRVKNNLKRYKRFADHIGQFPIIIISPTDTNLIIEGSDVRRKFIDSTISLYNPLYINTLIDYNKILKQRNFLLKQFNEKKYFDQINLDFYDQNLIKLGELIFKERKKFMNDFAAIFKNYYSKISDNNEEVDLIFNSQLNNKKLNVLLKESLPKDRNTNYTQCGIHKDDVLLKMNNHLIKKIGSQGQQKSFLIALKLAQFEFINNIGYAPILLLDDIFDKLDDNRVLKLVEFVKNKNINQVFITDTHELRCKQILDKTDIEFSIYTINNGQIENAKK